MVVVVVFNIFCVSHNASHTVHSYGAERPDQPVSDWLKEHPHHHQDGVAELGQRVAEEEARGRRRLRQPMTSRSRCRVVSTGFCFFSFL